MDWKSWIVVVVAIGGNVALGWAVLWLMNANGVPLFK